MAHRRARYAGKGVSTEGATAPFNGAILCEPQSACPELARSETHTVRIA
jgi:hypothetical protein